MLRDLIDYYEQAWLPLGNPEEERPILGRFRHLLSGGGAIFERDCFDDGHVTGSAMVVSRGLDAVLLTLHGKLKMWLQLGGHADGHPVVHDAAMREALEESGLRRLAFLTYEHGLEPPRPAALAGVPIPFDLDVHAIPARKSDPLHFHYDVRYAIVADPAEPLVISDESQDLRWFPLAEARRVTDERSMHRQFDKLARLREILDRRID